MTATITEPEEFESEVVPGFLFEVVKIPPDLARSHPLATHRGPREGPLAARYRDGQATRMDLPALRKLLADECFRRDAYDLGDPANAHSETYALREREGGWVTFYAERGHENDLEEHTTFADAAADLLGRLRADPSTRQEP